jgi:hypothetical protein
MRSARPPFLATWLLHWLYSGPNAEAVIGDLLERYQTTPSSMWYWRQVLTTIIVSSLCEIHGRTTKSLQDIPLINSSRWFS